MKSLCNDLSVNTTGKIYIYILICFVAVCPSRMPCRRLRRSVALPTLPLHTGFRYVPGIEIQRYFKLVGVRLLRSATPKSQLFTSEPTAKPAFSEMLQSMIVEINSPIMLCNTISSCTKNPLSLYFFIIDGASPLLCQHKNGNQINRNGYGFFAHSEMDGLQNVHRTFLSPFAKQPIVLRIIGFCRLSLSYGKLSLLLFKSFSWELPELQYNFPWIYTLHRKLWLLFEPMSGYNTCWSHSCFQR